MIDCAGECANKHNNIMGVVMILGLPDYWYSWRAPTAPPPALTMPALIFHGLEDTALHSDALNNTWDWSQKDVTIVTVPGAGHFVQQDAPALVSQTMRWWLSSRYER